jgi:hypothetical protein
MKNRYYTALSVLLIILLSCFMGCKKNDTPPAPPVLSLDEKVTATVQGRVTDEAGKPVNNASVKSGTNSTTTDINGVFRFTNIQLVKNAGYVSIEKAGYFKGSRTILTHQGAVNYVEIKLIPKTDRGNFASASGGTINTGNSSSVSFAANSIITAATNLTYSGRVNVKAAYLDVTAPDLSAIMPGNLLGINSANEMKLLQTFGMIVVELEGGAGEKLNIASGKTATLTMPVPAALSGIAPATIPLWSFNDTTGLWKEEGVATKQGNNYVGTVSHFSFWNCDVPVNFIKLKMTLKDQNQQLLTKYKVVITNTETNAQAYGFTDSSGVVSGSVPKDKLLKMEVYNDCNTVLYTQNIGPFASDADLGTVTITIPQSQASIISGTVKNCNNGNVVNGYVEILMDDHYSVSAITNGTFSSVVNRCSNTPSVAVLYAVDLDASQQGDTVSVLVNSGNVNAGILRACSIDISQFINFTINGQTINFVPPTDSLTSYRNGNITMISGYRLLFDSATYQYAAFNFSGAAAPGTYIVDSSSLIVTKGFTHQYNLKGAPNVTITEYGSAGQFVAGSFSGTFYDAFINIGIFFPGTCTFRVRRF